MNDQDEHINDDFKLGSLTSKGDIELLFCDIYIRLKYHHSAHQVFSSDEELYISDLLLPPSLTDSVRQIFSNSLCLLSANDYNSAKNEDIDLNLSGYDQRGHLRSLRRLTLSWPNLTSLCHDL